jgi:ArsR family transcriptional regulator
MKTSALTSTALCHQALAHPIRLRFLAALRDGRMCVGELQELSGLAFSTVSRHVSELEHAGLVEQRKAGRWVWCQLAAEPAMRGILECIWRQLAADPTIKRDQRRSQQLRAARRGSGCGVPDEQCMGEVAPETHDAAPVPEEFG